MTEMSDLVKKIEITTPISHITVEVYSNGWMSIDIKEEDGLSRTTDQFLDLTVDDFKKINVILRNNKIA